MRKFILSLAAVLTFSVSSAYAINEATYANQIKKQSVGQKQGESVRVLKLVRHASRDADTTSLASGDAVCYDRVSDDGVSVQRVTASADGTFAGIVATTIVSPESASTTAGDDAGKNNWGWIVVHGPATAALTAGGSNSHGIGDPMITSRDLGKVTTLESFRISSESALAGADAAALVQFKAATKSRGFFLDAASAADTTADVFVMAE